MNWITNSAAIVVTDSGNNVSQKNRKGPAPSMRHASSNSSGPVIVLQRPAARQQRHVATNHGGRVMGRGDQRDIDRKGHDEDAERQDRVGDDVVPRAVLDHQYCTLRSTYRNWTAVSAITITISTTDCAAEPPRSPPSLPSANTL